MYGGIYIIALNIVFSKIIKHIWNSLIGFFAIGLRTYIEISIHALPIHWELLTQPQKGRTTLKSLVDHAHNFSLIKLARENYNGTFFSWADWPYFWTISVFCPYGLMMVLCTIFNQKLQLFIVSLVLCISYLTTLFSIPFRCWIQWRHNEKTCYYS